MLDVNSDLLCAWSAVASLEEVVGSDPPGFGPHSATACTTLAGPPFLHLKGRTPPVGAPPRTQAFTPPVLSSRFPPLDEPKLILCSDPILVCLESAHPALSAQRSAPESPPLHPAACLCSPLLQVHVSIPSSEQSLCLLPSEPRPAQRSRHALRSLFPQQ